jgi:segregation and condensation protein A
MTDSAGTPPAAGDPLPDGPAAGRDPEGPGRDDDEAVEPVEVLVQLAEEGEIDPWDVDLVDATDAFLDRLAETDLRTSGRALFYAAVLLRMKSDALLEPDEAADPDPEPWEAALEGPGGPIVEDAADDAGFDPVDALEAEMDRRLERKQARGSPETLDELVRELREAEGESWWKRRREYDTSESPRGGQRGTQTLDYHTADARRDDAEPTAADVTDTAHSEDIEASIDAVREAVGVHYDRGRDEVLFAEVRDAAATPVTTYLAVLFLSHRGAVTLQQDDLFGDLWIRDPDVEWDDDGDAADAAAAGDGVAPAADDD